MNRIPYTLSRVEIPGGFIAGDSIHAYLHDHQGNVRRVVNAHTGAVEQETHYYPFGMPFGESTATALRDINGSAMQPRRYGGKESVSLGAFTFLDFPARPYDAATARFLTPDPLQEDYAPFSPYLYCMANPMNLTDPTGLSTFVRDNGDGTYTVEGGCLDDDLNIYISTRDADGNIIPSKVSVGKTPVVTSFYDSDSGASAEGAIINPWDNSGIIFIQSFIDNPPDIIEYALNAYGGQLYDFKRTNGTETTEDDNDGSTKDIYRGMPIPIGGSKCYSSARDIGNMMAGFVAGYNFIPWKLTRVAFDGLQSYQEKSFATEGMSSQNAQRYGYDLVVKTFKSQFSGAIRRLFK